MSQAIAYRDKDSGELHMLSDWLFVLPVDEEDEVSEGGIIVELLHTKNLLMRQKYMPHPELKLKA